MTDLDRQLADLERDLDALRATFRPGTDFSVRSKPAGRVKADRPRVPRPVAVAPPPAPAPSPVGLAAAKPAAPPPPSRPSGADLHGDPKNYGVWPEPNRLEPGVLAVEAFKARLVGDLKCAQEILHTSGVPAVTWREWRQFQKLAEERLRALG